MTDKTYVLELMGFTNFRRITSLSLEDARAAFVAAKSETYLPQNGRNGDTAPCHWNAWELYHGAELVKSGNFPEYQAALDRRAAIV